jgi:hypothetical protein
MPGGRNARMMIDQAEHLLRLMGEHEQLELRILTFDADIPYVDTGFKILQFPGDHQSDFAYVEYPGGIRKIRSAHEVRSCIDH